MNPGEIISYAIPIGVALAASIAAVLAFGVFLQVDRSLGRLIVPALLPLVAIGISVGSLLSNRNLTYASLSIDSINAGTEAAGGGSILRLISFSIIGLCGAKILGYLLNQKKQINTNGKPLFLAFVAFFIANAVLSSAFGAHPEFIHNTFYSIIVFTAVYLARDESLTDTIKFAKLALVAMMLLSLFVAVIQPQLAVQPNYKGWIPGLSIRLWGVGSNPNSIGPLALLLLMLESMQPFRKFWLRWLTILSAIAVFTLAQSKTVWAAGMVAIAIVFWYRNARSENGGMDPRFVLGIVVVLLIGTIGLAFADLDRIWNKITFTQAGTDITTLTGRAQIWATAINIWQDNPIFGYGPSAWGLEHRITIAMPFAYSAHNQFLQSLSVAGTLGGVTLLCYLLLLGAASLRAASTTRGISLALFATIIFRCMTEAPLSFGTILNGDFLTHALLFAIALRGRQAPQADAAPIPNTLTGRVVAQ
ncbi:MAG: O-antigen ligase family protein [Azonexus sp.]|nr:O-antigen ligase family protein [Azonexus sp.]